MISLGPLFGWSGLFCGNLKTAACVRDVEGKHFGGVQQPLRVKYILHAHLALQIFRRVLICHQVVHPSYAFDTNPASMRVRDDVALLELERPIRNTQIEPFETGSRPRKGEQVGVVSYARNRSEAPSLQEVCTVLARQSGVLVTSCSVDFGSSGAPIFTFVDGKAQIVSVVSAKAEVQGQDVSLGTALAEPLTFLIAELNAGRGVFQDPGPDAGRLRVGGARRDTGAKFVRPGE